MTQRFLVLGGNGFIGSHVVDQLLQQGSRVRVLDRSQGWMNGSQLGLDYRQSDFGDMSALAESLCDIDCVLHLVSTTVPATANLDPVADIEGNLVGTVKLLAQMREVGIKRLVYLSSGGTVYGNPGICPVPEGHCRQPLGSYGIVKSTVESYLEMYQLLHGFEVLTLRVSNPYGPRQGHLGVQGVVPTFFRRVLEGEELRVYGDGNAMRDYLYIDDLTRFIVTAVRRGLTGTFNVGSGEGTTLLELIELIGEITAQNPRVEFLPARGFDVQSIVLDISKARDALAWQPEIALLDGLTRYWHWLQQSGVMRTDEMSSATR